MGTGIGRGENRAMEAAQQAISSPLLDNVSVGGSTGVLLNITGGNDLTLGEVTQISEIVHDAVGDEAEIIFGAVNEPAMQGEIRVTVIATGFDRHVEVGLVGGSTKAPQPAVAATRNVIPLTQRTPPGRAASSVPRTVVPLADGASRRVIPPSPPQRQEPELTDMDIPTFIRRQMD
jgi:cell division protein FtsZ